MTLLIPPERYEIESSRLNWHLDRLSGVPGLPNGIAIMPTARSHAAVLRMPCASGKTQTVFDETWSVWQEGRLSWW